MYVNSVYNARPLVYCIRIKRKLLESYLLNRCLVGFVPKYCFRNNVKTHIDVIFEGNPLVYGDMVWKLDCWWTKLSYLGAY